MSVLAEALTSAAPPEIIRMSGNRLGALLSDQYSALAGTPYLQAGNKRLSYPSWMQLKAESWYYRLPIKESVLLLYGAALVLFIFSRVWRSSLLLYSFILLLTGFVCHTGLLALRCYILERPPVASMNETALYVPWISLLVGGGIHTFHPFPVCASRCHRSLYSATRNTALLGVDRSLRECASGP